jgi:hypothetical protein
MVLNIAAARHRARDLCSRALAGHGRADGKRRESPRWVRWRFSPLQARARRDGRVHVSQVVAVGEGERVLEAEAEVVSCTASMSMGM